jgi:DNA-binding transcriptional LysR family regulator
MMQDCAGETAPAAGGTSGPGTAAARQLAGRGADVIPGGRDTARGDAMQQDIAARQLISLELIRRFVVVAEELHFGRAATRLYISQPGLSQAIARLERDLDVQLFRRTRSSAELTDAGAELLQHARGLLADLENAVARVRIVGRGAAGLVRVGVATLAEPVVAPALRAFAEDHREITLDRFAMASEPLFARLRDGLLHAAVIYEIPALATADGVTWEPVRRGRLAVLAGADSRLARREIVMLPELSDETFLVNPRSIAPGALEGLRLMCREWGGFDATVLESAVAPAAASGLDWRPIRDGAAVVVMPEATARAVRPAGVAVIPVSPPPQYVLTMVWRRDERSAAVHRFLGYVRSYRDQHAWVVKAECPLSSWDPTFLTCGDAGGLSAAQRHLLE